MAAERRPGPFHQEVAMRFDHQREIASHRVELGGAFPSTWIASGVVVALLLGFAVGGAVNRQVEPETRAPEIATLR
jgi:hypothetical protein